MLFKNREERFKKARDKSWEKSIAKSFGLTIEQTVDIEDEINHFFNKSMRIDGMTTNSTFIQGIFHYLEPEVQYRIAVVYEVLKTFKKI